MRKKQDKPTYESHGDAHLVLKPGGPPHRYVGDNPNLVSLDCSGMSALPTIALKNNPKLRRIIFDYDLSSYKIVTQGSVRQIKDGKRRQTANLNFLETPQSNVRIDGQLGEISVNHNGHKLNSGIGTKMMMTRLERAKNAFISLDTTSFAQMSDFEFGILLLDGNDKNKKISVGEGINLCHFSVIGPSICEDIIINVPEGAQRIIIKNMPNLKSITINGSTKILEVINCINLTSLSGFGQHLLLENTGIELIDGMWMETVQGHIPSRTRKLTSQNLQYCNDLSFVKVLPAEYEIFIKWCDIFDIDSIQLGEGIPLPDLIDVILISGADKFSIIIDWFDEVITLQEQYYAMRIITALAKRGFPKKLVWNARQKVIHNNFELSRANSTLDTSSASFNFIFNQSKTIKRFTNNNSSPLPKFDEYYWTTPNRSFIPFERLDMEIWLSCYESLNKMPAFPSAKKILQEFDNSTGLYGLNFMPNLNNRSIELSRKKLLALLDSSKHNAGDMKIQNAINKAIDTAINILESSSSMLGATVVFEYLALFAIENCYFNIEYFANAIIESTTIPVRSKAALLCGMIYYSDDINIRIKLMLLISDTSLTREESKDINIIATCGKRAYLEKGIKPLKWPFVNSWGKIHGR